MINAVNPLPNALLGDASNIASALLGDGSDLAANAQSLANTISAALANGQTSIPTVTTALSPLAMLSAEIDQATRVVAQVVADATSLLGVAVSQAVGTSLANSQLLPAVTIPAAVGGPVATVCPTAITIPLMQVCPPPEVITAIFTTTTTLFSATYYTFVTNVVGTVRYVLRQKASLFLIL